MKKIITSTVLISTLVFAGGDIAPVVEEPIVEETANWSFELSPYLAMSSISGDSSVISDAVTPVDIGFDDILDALEFSVPVHFEAIHNSGWGLWLDYNYASLGGSAPIGSTTNTLTVDVKQAVFEAFGMYRQTLKNGTFDYLTGIRSWNLKLDAFRSNRPNRNNTENNWVDFVVGARWTTNINENWKFYVRGDVGAGGSDFTAAAAAGLKYTINEWLDVDMQYKGLWVDYEAGTVNTLDYFKYDTVTYGPVLGLNFKF